VFDTARLAAVRRTGLLDTGPDEAFDRLTRLAATLLGTPFAFVTLVDDTRSFWKSRTGVDATVEAERQHPIGESFCQYVIGTDREVIVTDAASDARIWGGLSIGRMRVRAWAGFPIRSADGHVLGTFCAVDTVARDWTPHDLEVLHTLSHAAAGEIALRIAVSDADQATRQAQSSARDAQTAILEALEAADESAMLARTLQESLLPSHLPKIPGLDLAAHHLRGGRGADVLGDFYDVFQSPQGNWGLVVGDVSGKGAQAAKTTALARYTLRAAAVRTSTPSTNLAALNTALLDWFTDDAQFLTAVYATVRPHPAGFTVQVACGGHEPALIRRHDGRVEPLGVPGIILGCVDDPLLRDQRTVLRTGDSMIMYTDGVTEARRPEDRDMFGTERLSGLLAETSATSAAHLAAAIETAVLDFTGRHISDDTAILAVHVATDPSAT
jgi:serine phosphatase RsbU (regulator of sigma subunit)